ncbi:MAG: site-specific DNA-methyltransferase (adenine-specific) [Caulobacteraceae bacterium]|nr:MAG: site-specific DNA-methyltransferase (adenine-specific) [Caulobacteraceae bacterium]
MARNPRGSTKKAAKPKKVETITHDAVRRRNAPTAELQSIAERVEEMAPTPPIRFERATPLKAGAERTRDKDLDPQIVWNGAKIKLTAEQVKRLAETGEIEIGEAQLVWRGKDRQDWSDLVVNAPPIYIQEKIHPKALIDELQRQSKKEEPTPMLDLFADFNGLEPDQRTEFYQHGQHWSNRMILGDSLQVMASLAQREALKGKVQCIYFDPPYGIKFNSNWQVSTLSRDVKDGKHADISREPEQIKAFRDTWKDGIHSYLTYLRDRLTVMRELLTLSGSIFVQIGDENVHRVRAVMDEVFGEDNFCSSIFVLKTTGAGSPAVSTDVLASVADYVLWYARDISQVKYRREYASRRPSDDGNYRMARESGVWDRSLTQEEMSDVDGLPAQLAVFAPNPLTSQTAGATTTFPYIHRGQTYEPGKGGWKTNARGFERLDKAARLHGIGRTLRFVRFFNDFPFQAQNNLWDDARQSGFGSEKIYVVQTTPAIIQRCMLMATDPGDLVLDPTCGSGTAAFVAEQWGRRWITIDTSRVALALARTRLMSARYPFYLLADSKEGREKEMQVSGRILPDAPVNGDVRQGFVYERAPHVTLKSIANNAEIDVIWETAQRALEPLREALNAALGKTWAEWEIPREAGAGWSDAAKQSHAKWWEARIARQKEIDASIAKNADVELLYDRPYQDTSRVRVAGPFTVESLSPHRVVPADEEELIDLTDAEKGKRRRTKFVTPPTDFAELVLEYLRTTGVHQAEKRDTIKFLSVQGWPGEYVNAEARFMEGEKERRAAVFIGPEFGTLSRVDLAAAAREATDGRFDALIACAFNFDAHANMDRLGPLPILKAKMNPDLHMGGELKNTGKGNLFVVFGEPDIDIEDQGNGTIQVRVKGIDVFDPNTGEIRSNDTKGIAAWFIDDDYNEESFFVRHAYFLGANDPYKALKTALKAEIDETAWAGLYSEVSRPFKRPDTKRIAVKVINHFGDEVMKVFAV